VIALVQHGWLLAQEAQVPPAADPMAFLKSFLPLILIMIFFYIFMIRAPQKKKDEEFRKLVADLKENDHIVTIGGIHGVVTNVQRDADRVTIRVDESTGAKLRINASAIARVVTDDDNSNGASSGGKSK
jgi:preprotein translocase subunit YajC